MFDVEEAGLYLVYSGCQKYPDNCFFNHCQSVLIFIKTGQKCFFDDIMNVNEILLLIKLKEKY